MGKETHRPLSIKEQHQRRALAYEYRQLARDNEAIMGVFPRLEGKEFSQFINTSLRLTRMFKRISFLVIPENSGTINRQVADFGGDGAAFTANEHEFWRIEIEKETGRLNSYHLSPVSNN